MHNFSTTAANNMFLKDINTFMPRQNGRHVADDIFKRFLTENVWIYINISLEFISNW